MTVLEAIQRTTEFLGRKGVDSPRLQAELLLAHVMQWQRMQLYLNFEQTLTAPQTDELRAFVQRRAQHEPLQQILGSTSFCGFEIRVNRHVLVPRPETELLAERGWRWLAASSQKRNDGVALSVLDFGTGSGCIAVALARSCSACRVTAMDSSADALRVAAENLSLNGVADRVQLLSGSSLADIGEAEMFDLLISNPPYIPTAEIAALQPEVRDYEPRAALDGGADGLDFYRMLAQEGRRVLKRCGRLMLEVGDGQSQKIAGLLEDQNWIVEALEPDYTGRQRLVVAAPRKNHDPSEVA